MIAVPAGLRRLCKRKQKFNINSTCECQGRLPFFPCHFTSSPVRVENEQLACLDTFADPPCIEYDFSFLSSVLSVQTLSRLLMRVNWKIQC